MTDKAEMPAEISVWLDRWGDHRLCAESFDDTTRYIRADLHDAQAAEIERLRFESDQLRHVKLGLEVQVMEQAAYIERLRGRIRIAEGTLVAWLREQGGGVDPVRHALATLRNMP